MRTDSFAKYCPGKKNTGGTCSMSKPLLFFCNLRRGLAIDMLVPPPCSLPFVSSYF